MIEHFAGDKSTIFSIVPYDIHEFKPGLYPGDFKIPGCLDDTKPVRLVIGASEHIIHLGDQRPMRIVTPSFQIARAIVDDFLDGQLWVSPEERPGISWIQGDISDKEFLEKHIDILKRMQANQKRWFVRLCQKTDNEWNKYENSRVVSDQSRFAAKALGLTPAWLTAETIGLTFKKCPSCSTPNDPMNAVCTNCRCILNEDKFKLLKFA